VGIMANAFAQITAAGAQHSKELFEINKAAGIANAITSTYQGAAKALEWGWPMGPIFAGLITADGMAKVKAIQSQQFSGGGGAAPSSSAGGGVPSTQPAARAGGGVPSTQPAARAGGQQQQQQEPQRIFVEFAGDDDKRVSLREMRQNIRQLKDENPDSELVF